MHAFQRDGIMYYNERFWNLNEWILDGEYVYIKVVELIKNKSNIYEGVEKYIDI